MPAQDLDPAFEPQHFRVVRAFLAGLQPREAVLDQDPGALVVAAAREAFGLPRLEIPAPDAVAGVAQMLDALIKLRHGFSQTTSFEPGHAAADLGHDLAEQRDAAFLADALGFLGALL